MNNVADRVSTEISPVATLDPERCQFSFADGRRCRSQRWEAHPALCIAHAREQARASSPSDWQPQKTGPYLQPPGNNRSGLHLEPGEMIDLAPLSGEFRTATDVNRALSRLFSLLAQNRIPRRNAVALGYLAQLLLQTLPGVHKEIIDGLGYEGWDETLDSVFGKAQAEDETDDDETKNDETEEDETEAEPEAKAASEIEVRAEQKAAAVEAKPQDLREPPVIESALAAAASEPQPPIDEKVTATAAAPALTPAEIFAQVQAEIFTGRGSMSPTWNYWEELERVEHLRKMRH